MADFLSTLWQWLLRIAAGAVILLALLVGVARLLLPEASRFADDVRRVAQEASGFEVDFQLLSAGVTIYGPELRLSGVTVNWPDGEEVAAVAEIGIAIDLPRLVLSQKVAPAMVYLEGVAIDLEVDREGTLLLQGRPFDDYVSRRMEGQTPQELRIGLEDIDVRFADRKRGIGPVDAQLVSFFAHIDAESVTVEADIRPTPEFGKRIEIEGLLPVDLVRDRQELTSATRWNLDVGVEDFRLDPWLKLVDLQDAPVIDSEGTATASVDFAGLLPVGVTIAADISGLALAQPDGEPVYFDDIRGELGWQREGIGWQAYGTDLYLERAGRSWPPGAFRVSQQKNEDGTSDWSATADFVRLDDVMLFISAVVAPQLQEAGITGLPSGDIWRMQAAAKLAGEELRTFSVEGDFDRLGFVDPARGIEVRGLSGSLRADERGGSARLATRDARLGLDAFFRDTLAVSSLEGLALWRAGAESVRLIVSDLYLETPDGGGTASFELITDLEFTNPIVDLTAEAGMADAREVLKYLPRKVPDRVIAWLGRALEQGNSPGTEFRLRGPLRKFPFRGDEGEWLIDIDFRDVRLRYAEDWPAIEDASGHLVFSNESIYSTRNRATSAGMEVRNASVRVADIKQAMLEVDAGAEVPLTGLLRFLRDTPVAGALGEVFTDVRAGGRGKVRGNLQISLRDLKQWQFRGALDVTDASAWLRTLEPRFRNIRGRINIEDTYISAEGLTATLLDEPVAISIVPDLSPEAVFSHRAEVSGRFPYDTVQDALALPQLGVVDGSAELNAAALFPAQRGGDEPFRIIVNSDLTGLASSLPEPLGKEADAAERFAAEVYLPREGAIDISMSLERGVLTDLNYRRQDDRWQLRGGRMRIGTTEETPLSEDGVALTVATDRLRFEDWLEAFDEEATAATVLPEGRRIWQDYFASADLRVDELEILGYLFIDTDVSALFGADSWEIDVAGPWVEGQLNVPFDLGGAAGVRADLDRLLLIEPVSAAPGDPDEYAGSPLDIPGFSGTVGDFAYGDMRLGRLDADVRPVADGVEARSLNLTAPSFTALLSGDWKMVDNAQRSRLHLEVDSTDVETTLDELGLVPLLSGESGSLVADLIWEGGPGDEIIGATTGTVTLRAGDGAINDLDAGGGRLLGLLSIAALPRRLALDFTDLTEDKLAFSEISADFRMDFGDAWTCNLGVEGDVADMALVGRTGITAEDYNQVAIVRPHLSNMLPVPAAVLAGPTAGVAALLVSQIFKKPISGIGETYYTISGSWEDSAITRVQRSELDTTPFADCEAQLPTLSPEEVAAIEELLKQSAEPPADESAVPDAPDAAAVSPATP